MNPTILAKIKEYTVHNNEQAICANQTPIRLLLQCFSLKTDMTEEDK